MNEKKDKDYFRALAKQCMFEFKEEELDQVGAAFEVLEKQMEFLSHVDTEGIEPMNYPFEEETMFLRDDVVNHVVAQDEALKNAAKSRNGHILVPKVIR